MKYKIVLIVMNLILNYVNNVYHNIIYKIINVYKYLIVILDVRYVDIIYVLNVQIIII